MRNPRGRSQAQLAGRAIPSGAFGSCGIALPQSVPRMIIYPAMDLIGGTAVRLKQGRFDLVTAYETDPLEALRQFATAGAEWAHVVDLDGARVGSPVQHELIAEL